jgi:hypothetical protein
LKEAVILLQPTESSWPQEYRDCPGNDQHRVSENDDCRGNKVIIPDKSIILEKVALLPSRSSSSRRQLFYFLSQKHLCPSNKFISFEKTIIAPAIFLLSAGIFLTFCGKCYIVSGIFLFPLQ